MYTYYLSNRQRKELLVRQAEICVAIPWMYDDPRDECEPRTFVLHALEGIEPHWLRSAEEVDVVVNPLMGGDGLTGLLGRIVDDTDPGPPRYSVLIAAVVATLRAGPVRHFIERVQWVGDVRLAHGVRLSQHHLPRRRQP
jgi:hypothetical protein